MTDRFLFDPARVPVEPNGPLPDAMGAGGRPIHVEVGFGKDIRILRLAGADADALFLGIEISGKKFMSFCRKVARAGLENVRGYRGDVRPVLAEMLPEASVASFTVLFPDPWPKRKQQKHRWIQEPTARHMERALAPGGSLTVATDHDGYAAQIEACLSAAGLELVSKRAEVAAEDRSLFAQRFERLGESVTWMKWRRQRA